MRIHSLRDQTRHIEAHLETAENILPRRARMGFVLQVTYQGPSRFYECLPRAGIIRHRADLDGTHIGGLLMPPLAPKRGRTKAQRITRLIARRLPFDRQAHWNGSSRPRRQVHRHPRTTGQAAPGFDDPGGPSRQFAEPELYFATHCANRFIHRDAAVLCRRAGAAQRRLGKTRFEQDTSKTHWIHALKGFIPFWGSLEDLQSDSPEKRALGVLGLFLDIVSFAIPLANLSPAASVLQPWQEEWRFASHCHAWRNCRRTCWFRA